VPTSNHMTGGDLSQMLAARFGIPKIMAAEIIHAVFSSVHSCLATPGSTVSIKGFGVFKVKLRKAHLGRNPKDGTKVAVPAKFVVSFHPSRQFFDEGQATAATLG